MDESWRMHMGTPNLSRRRSTDADDFSDVFGGTPRTVSGRKMSVEFTAGNSFYEDIFWNPQAEIPANKTGRSLKAFSIPARSETFYNDIFGSDEEDRNRRSKGKSSSEELSTLRPMTGDDVALGLYASKLRQINVSKKWNSFAKKPTTKPSVMEVTYPYISTPFQRVTSPEMIDYEFESDQSVSIPTDDSFLDSPSIVSSSNQNWEDKTEFYNDRHDDKVMSSYVIEINSDHYVAGNDDAISEAVAWAKQKFHQLSPEKNCIIRQGEEDTKLEEKSTKEAKQQSEDDRESRLLDEDMEMWSSGKETT